MNDLITAGWEQGSPALYHVSAEQVAALVARIERVCTHVWHGLLTNYDGVHMHSGVKTTLWECVYCGQQSLMDGVVMPAPEFCAKRWEAAGHE